MSLIIKSSNKTHKQESQLVIKMLIMITTKMVTINYLKTKGRVGPAISQ